MNRLFFYGFVLVALCAAGAAFAARHGARPASGARPAPRATSPQTTRASSVVFTAPKAGAKVKGITTVKVLAPAGTQWVGFYACNGRSAGEDTLRDSGGGWSLRWDTTMRGCSNGSSQLSAFAFNGAGDELGVGYREVTIRNTARRKPPLRVHPCRVSSVPRPIAGQGYKLRFSDCFSTLSSRVWCSHQWYESPPRVGTQYVDKSGVLHIVRRRADGYPDNTISSEPCGQRAPKSFTFGYFAARMRWTGASGSGPAFWLFSTRHAANPDWPHVNPYCARHGLPAALCYSAEIDVFEGYGNHLNVFTGTVHRNSCNCYGVNDEQNSNNWHPLAGVRNLAAGWHTYAAKWTRTSVSWYVDGRLITSAPVYDSTNQPMHLLFYNWNTTDWEPGNHTDSSTPRELQTLVDWVRVWQR